MRIATLDARSADGIRSQPRLAVAADPFAALVWLPALGVPARAYDGFASSLAAAGITVLVHEWRGIGSSSVRASRACDWGYAQLLSEDIAATQSLAERHLPGGPRVWGGHSLGGQLAALALATAAARGDGLALVASGTPHWPRQRAGVAVALLAAMLVVPPLTTIMGHLPGRRIGFGGREARGVMRDWLRSARTGRYRADGMPGDLERGLGGLDLPVLGLGFRNDRFAPSAALDGLLLKTACSDCERITVEEGALGVPADHFSWMGRPGVVAAHLGRWVQGRLARSTLDPDRHG